MAETLAAYYDAKVEEGLSRDPAQLEIVARLDALRSELDDYRSGGLSRLFGRGSAPRGVYLWGDVGRGKSMLVDGLMQTMGDIPARRTHFHAFMRDIHRALHTAREQGRDELVHHAADAQVPGLSLLALDELEIVDIVDAMIVGRVFSRVLERGCTVVVTSNRPPAELYRDGLKRDLFLPFVRLIEERLDVLHLDGGRDYRVGSCAAAFYAVGDDGAEGARIDALWDAAGDAEREITIGASGVMRRKGGMVRADFAALCRVPMAPSSYLDLAEQAEGLILDNVPVLGERDHDAARRFILLVDTLYDAGCGLAVRASTEPEVLYRAGEFGAEFRRTVSRLHEMTRPDWRGASTFR
ncbi:cell division protein ZapE [Palleronia pelagia]|uniref:Cell division protein ZapE n=1 Tax=Palleronia pelagia TaxID=387096 RepID=A0A1H8AGQ4_9RHOB|nr:cell division protein ZapE [Palleronia pelagia]SEM69992.1 cell division protein ZapE [Palleronia pelagia]